MLVHHASPLSSSRDNITKVRHADEDGRKVHAHEGPQQAQQFITNEQGEHEEKKMSVNCLLNNPVDEIRTSSNSILRNSKEIGRSTDSISKEIKPERSAYDDQYIEYIEGSPPTTPTVSTPTPQRAPCSVCKNETGRCHASDPSTMQSFFASTLGFEGILNVSDWLCMKCYSKWYNRCKRKATSALAMTVVDPSVPLPQQKRKRREKDKEGNAHKADGEKSLKDSDRDTDSDDALLLARIGGNFPSSGLNSSGSVPNEDSSDLDGASVEELRAEVGRLKQEMRKLVTDLSQRDEQIENMMKFVKTEVAGMHDLLKEIYNAKYATSSATSSSGGSQGTQAPPLHHLPPSNHPTSIPSIPALFPVPLLGKDHS